MSTLNLINLIQSGKTRDMEATFENIMQSKIEDAIEVRRMEISQSMFDTVDESEELDELSKSTLGSYVKKATHDVQSKGFDAGYTEGSETAKAKKYGDGTGAGAEQEKMADKRRMGVSKAVNKLVK